MNRRGFIKGLSLTILGAAIPKAKPTHYKEGVDATVSREFLEDGIGGMCLVDSNGKRRITRRFRTPIFMQTGDSLDCRYKLEVT